MEPSKLKPVQTKEPVDETALDDEYLEPTKEELLEDIRIGLRQAIAGDEGMPALESLEELRREIYGDADSR